VTVRTGSLDGVVGVLAQGGTGAIGVDAASFLVIVVVAAVAALLAALVSRRLPLPVVVVEIVLGVVVGPDVLGLAEPDHFIEFFSNLGLGMLFYFAGYEIDFARVRGAPLRLAVLGWLFSLVLAYLVGGLLSLAGLVLSLVFTGSAIATTAIGTLIPLLRDAGELRTGFGTLLLAAGAVGEFGPILLVTLVLSTRNPLSSAAILVLFVAVAVLAAVFAIRSVGRGFEVLDRTLEGSGQLAVRLSVVMVFALVGLAAELGLDLLLGGFVAGIITRAALSGREVERLESKLVAVGYGFFIPFFFVVSGLKFDLDALLGSTRALLELPLFLALMLLVRGLPALLLYRDALSPRDRAALAFFSATELPLVVAITTLAVEGGHMRGSTAASLVGAAILSTLLFPLAGLRLRAGGAGIAPAR
jgi:Kef-type K+ transport system membrane component KefB